MDTDKDNQLIDNDLGKMEHENREDRKKTKDKKTEDWFLGNVEYLEEDEEELIKMNSDSKKLEIETKGDRDFDFDENNTVRIEGTMDEPRIIAPKKEQGTEWGKTTPHVMDISRHIGLTKAYREYDAKDKSEKFSLKKRKLEEENKTYKGLPVSTKKRKIELVQNLTESINRKDSYNPHKPVILVDQKLTGANQIQLIIPEKSRNKQTGENSIISSDNINTKARKDISHTNTLIKQTSIHRNYAGQIDNIQGSDPSISGRNSEANLYYNSSFELEVRDTRRRQTSRN
ncbi:uncharacterized protein LOC123989242 isoform X2 [Osmia bicornis bicornis]|uniref:uncharacterized protein LOC123989242 isoform X2 n=1 Tax=Osmia bicornis bicornis TaxID=1437191 RepID=UPI001EAEBB5B|nr:uncharacterized protein LOC123989242 isoform X2 [Osmia bicornis bicornis]